METKTFKEQAFAALGTVIDPELGVDLVSLGLIYDVTLSPSGVANVTMTLTIVGCPLTEWLADAIHDALMQLPGVKSIEVEITFDPAWNESMMSRAAKLQLGLH